MMFQPDKRTQKISSQVDVVSASEAVLCGLITIWVKPKTIKIGIHNFLANV